MLQSPKVIALEDFTFEIKGISETDPYFQSVSNNFEQEFLSICKHSLVENAICFDLGANIGVKSLYLSRLAKNGKVISVEANAEVVDALKYNIEHNQANNIIVEQIAIGDRIGEINFYSNSAWGHISSAGSPVPLTTLDALVAKHGLKSVDFIKIDVEGFELQALQGAFNSIKKFRPLVYFELNSHAQISYGNINPKKLMNFVFDNFSSVFLINRNICNDSPLLEKVSCDAIPDIFRRNILHDNSVTDVLAGDDERWGDAFKHLSLLSMYDAAIRERDTAIHERNIAIDVRDSLEKEKDTAERMLKQLASERDKLLTSRSWKLTAPLRFIRQCL